MEMQGTKRTTGCKGRVEREMLGEMKKRRNGGREEGKQREMLAGRNAGRFPESSKW